MRIGIDVSPLQGPHRMRGVGSVVINLINNLPDSAKKTHEFVFYMNHDDESIREALKLLNLEGLNYDIRPKPPFKPLSIRLPGRLNLLAKVLNKLLSLPRFRRGTKGYDYDGLDAYLHTDQLVALPHMRGVSKILIAYDLIPYILEADYLWSYKTARSKGLSRKGALAAAVRRHTYISKLRINSQKASRIIAISEQTKDDFVRYAGASKKKISVVYLGVDQDVKASVSRPPAQKYAHTSWGYFPKKFSFDLNTPYLLFVGGTDARRRLDHLVTAFNHLRAQGHQLKLVLSGDILQGPGNLPVKENREALLNSSYADDIIYLGFVDEEIRNWLYENALAFVYPSVYEGFGLPVLEAMSYGCPAITYKNSSLAEVAGGCALYAEDSLSIAERVEELLNNESLRRQCAKKGQARASKFSWVDTAKQLMDLMASK